MELVFVRIWCEMQYCTASFTVCCMFRCLLLDINQIRQSVVTVLHSVVSVLEGVEFADGDTYSTERRSRTAASLVIRHVPPEFYLLCRS
jgi:hypothetical protein